jgi:hypothetical protein
MTATEINAERIAEIMAKYHYATIRAVAHKIVEAFPELRAQSMEQWAESVAEEIKAEKARNPAAEYPLVADLLRERRK